MAKDERGNTYVSEAQSKASFKWESYRKAKVLDREARCQARAERTDEQQLARLDEIFGEGMGATRERERLLKRIEDRKKKTEEKTEEAKKEEKSTNTKE